MVEDRVSLLPASFLISPVLWRGVCPVATLNMFSNGWIARRKIGTAASISAGTIGGLGAAAVGSYYWFGIPEMVGSEAWEAGPSCFVPWPWRS